MTKNVFTIKSVEVLQRFTAKNFKIFFGWVVSTNGLRIVARYLDKALELFVWKQQEKLSSFQKCS